MTTEEEREDLAVRIARNARPSVEAQVARPILFIVLLLMLWALAALVGQF